VVDTGEPDGGRTMNMDVIYWVIGALIVLIMVLVTGFILVSDRSVKTSANQHPAGTLDKLEVIIRLLYSGARITPAMWDDDAVLEWAKSNGFQAEKDATGGLVLKRPAESPPMVQAVG